MITGLRLFFSLLGSYDAVGGDAPLGDLYADAILAGLKGHEIVVDLDYGADNAADGGDVGADLE